jgi:hypothetical protein
VDNWFISYWDKYNLYLTLKEAVGKEAFANLTESDIPDACTFMTSVGKDSVRWYAYGKKINDLNAHHNPVRPGVMDWTDKGGSLSYIVHPIYCRYSNFKVFSVPTES